jgi:hypothetical protein
MKRFRLTPSVLASIAMCEATWFRRSMRCVISLFFFIDLSVAAEAVHLQLALSRLATGLDSAAKATAILASIDPHADLPWDARELLRVRLQADDMPHLHLVVMREPDQISMAVEGRIECWFVGRLADISWPFSFRSAAPAPDRHM